jgi:hypothetical protein
VTTQEGVGGFSLDAWVESNPGRYLLRRFWDPLRLNVASRRRPSPTSAMGLRQLHRRRDQCIQPLPSRSYADGIRLMVVGFASARDEGNLYSATCSRITMSRPRLDIPMRGVESDRKPAARIYLPFLLKVQLRHRIGPRKGPRDR